MEFYSLSSFSKNDSFLNAFYKSELRLKLDYIPLLLGYSNYKKFSKKWWVKRNEAFDYMEFLMKKLKIKINKGPDFYFTKLINLLY